MAGCWARSARKQQISVDSDGLNKGKRLESKKPGKPDETARFLASGSVCAAGAGPGLQNQSPKLSISSSSIDSVNTYVDLQTEQHSHLADCLARLAQVSPDLALIIDRWKTLPPALKDGILAMVKATTT